MDKSLVSIVVSAYNAEKYLDETIKVLAQTYLNWEWIVVDSGLTDGTTAPAGKPYTEFQSRGILK